MTCLRIADEVLFDATKACLIYLAIFDALVVDAHNTVHTGGAFFVVLKPFAAALLLAHGALVMRRL